MRLRQYWEQASSQSVRCRTEWVYGLLLCQVHNLTRLRRNALVTTEAEHPGLRTRDELLALIDAAGLQVLGRKDARPKHPKARDESAPLHAARSAEVTLLWRLGAR